MLSKDQIRQLFFELDAELKVLDVIGEVCIFGGTVMSLVYNARPATKDVDAIFVPTEQIRNAIAIIAMRHGIREDWMNDSVKGFVVPSSQQILFDLPNLKVYTPPPDYLLAMKAIAARTDTQDRDDIIFLVRKLGLQSPEEVFGIIGNYYPHIQIKPATQFFIEEIFQDEHGA